MVESLGCTYGYISQLRCGHRRPEHIGQDFADRVGAYLGVPTALVKLVAGRVTVDDFRWPQRDESQDIAECLKALREDPAIGGYVPPQLDHADPQVQRFVWLLYTECADRHTAALQAMPKMLGYLQRAAEGHARYEQALAALKNTVAARSACTEDTDCEQS